VRSLLRPTVHRFEASIIYPWAAWRGWRPSSLRSVRPDDLRWNYGYENESSVKEAIARVTPYTVLSLDRLASLWWQLDYLDRQDVTGALVECGVRLGGASAMMALAHMSHGAPARELHLFDSFSTMPPPSSEDGPLAPTLSKNWTEENLDYSMEISRNLLLNLVRYPEALLQYHVGWFQDTVVQAAEKIGPIALLRLDGDWYDSTKVCLDALYPKVNKGGIVVIDDYGHFEGCRRAVDEFSSNLPKPFLLHRIDCTGRYWIK
jgi:O-methyltransferase